MRFMLTPRRANGSARCTARRAGRLTNTSSEVRSLPEGGNSSRPITRKRVVLSGRSSIGPGDDLQAVHVRRAARRRSPPRRRHCARGARPRHCSTPRSSPPSAGAGAATPCTARATADASRRARCPRCGRCATSRYWCTRSSTSPQIFSVEVRNMSSVDWIVPCPEFSTGTTPKSAWPGFDFLEHFLDARQRQAVRRMAEVLVAPPAARTCLPGRGSRSSAAPAAPGRRT